MSFSGLLVQLLGGLASASSLFLVAAGLSLIFGVTRIVNFAHGSFFMLGAYIACTLVERFGAVLGFWPALLAAALAVGVLGALIEMLLLRRIYQAPELFQLLATFALVLVIKDAALYLWGPEELLGPRAPGLGGAVQVLGRRFPSYDLLLIAIGPLVLALLWLLLRRTRLGTLVRAATQDREMVSALGIHQAWLFTAVFALGAALAGLGGALQLPREPAHLEMDLNTVVAAFVVVVAGGMGSLPGAYLAALLISVVKALCVWLGVVTLLGHPVNLSKATLVVDFVVMAAVLIWRPWGLLGRPQAGSRRAGAAEAPLRRAGTGQRVALAALALALVALPWLARSGYASVLATDLAIAALFAASLHFIMGPGGLHSFGHAAYFGVGAYGAALALKAAGLPMAATLLIGPLLAALAALAFGWFAVRLSGVYLAMLTLAFAQIVWAITYQWDGLTGGSNGLTGIWPTGWLAGSSAYYWLTLALAGAGLWALRRLLFAPFGYALRAGRDAPLRADAIGIDLQRVQWLAFAIAGLFAGVAGALFAYSKGSISPESMAIGKSVDGLVMVLLGGLQALAGPVVGAVSFTWLQDAVARHTDYWRALLGAVMLVLVLAFPDGLAGGVQKMARRWRVGGRLSPTVRAELACPEPGLRVEALPGASAGPHPSLPPEGEGAKPPFGAHGSKIVAGHSAAAPLLTVRDLGKSFGGVQAVDGIGFDLAPGELLALIGPNGAGKSTTFNMVGGQIQPDRGAIRLDGRELAGLRPRQIWRLGVGRTFQIAETFASLTVAENVQLALLSRDGHLYSPWRRAADYRRAEALARLDQVGMAGQAERPCSELAYGDIKRVELAIAIAHNPRLLLMDEPAAGMAPAERHALMALTRRLVQERGMAVLFTEHSMDVVFTHADRVLVLARGRLIAAGAPQDIRAHPEVRAVYLGAGQTFGKRHG